YLERSAAAVRRGHGGTEVVPADGLVAAAFRHRTSRVGDPQLHTHVLVANLGRGDRGGARATRDIERKGRGGGGAGHAAAEGPDSIGRPAGSRVARPGTAAGLRCRGGCVAAG